MAVLLALALMLADPPAPEAPVPAKVAVDILVRDVKGRTVEQLTASELTITEGDEPRPIESVRFVRATGDVPVTSQDGDAAAESGGRLVAIFLDEYHVRPGAGAERASQTLAAFVRRALGPSDRLVVLKPLDPLGDIAVTADRSAGLQAIETFDPRADDLTARTDFERNYIAGAPEHVAAARAQIATASIGALTRTLGALGSGRKTLIVVSDGFVPRRTGRRGDAALPGFDEISATANRVNVSIYPVFVGDATGGDQGSDGSGGAGAGARTALEQVAAETAGAVVTRDHMDAGLRAALDDASGYYEVTFAQPLAPAGRLHRLQVAVRRSGALVRTRSAYGSPMLRVAEPVVRALPRTSLVPRRTSPLIRPWFGMSPAADGTTRVSFVWEPAPRLPGDRAPRATPARIALQVTSDDGTILFDGVVSASGSNVVSTTVAPPSANFTSPAGRVLAQMSIEDAAATRLDSDVRDVLVTRFGDPLALGSPAMFRARTARDFDGILADAVAAPVASRQFSRAERLLVRVPMAAGTGAAVSARLVNDRGGTVRELVVSRQGGRTDVVQIDLPLAPFPVGGYSIEIVAKESDRESRERVAFRVTP